MSEAVDRKDLLPLECELSTPERRRFLKSAAFLGGSAALAAHLEDAFSLLAHAASPGGSSGSYPLSGPERVIYSVCLQCHTACPIKGKIFNGVLAKIDGNPYSAQNLRPQLSGATAPVVAALHDAPLCPKGQAGIQSLYDPYRLRKVLKRTGPRGSNQWQTISLEKAIEEIVEGGYLFAHVGGEEKRRVPGLRELFALRDAKLSKQIAADTRAVADGKLSLADFQERYKEQLSLLVDPAHPDLGPRNNQFVFLAGRIEHGRKEFSKRWLKDAFGSVNWFEHTSICEQSHHIAYQQMTNQYSKGEWQKGRTHMKPDLQNAEFVLFFGTGPFEANFGPTNMASKLTDGSVTGRLKFAVADPRLSKTAAKAWKWLPLQPGTDAALAYGLMRWIFDQGKFDARFLRAANRAAARQAGEHSFSNATWLVKLEPDGPGVFLRAAEINLGSADQFVVIRDGQPVAVDPNDNQQAVTGTLFYQGEINGFQVKTALTLLRDRAEEYTVGGWATRCGLREEDVVAVARELAAHGKRAAVELYRGPVQHTNGYYNAQAVISLNFLIGNVDWKGGLALGGGHWHEDGSRKGQPFPMGKLHPNKLTAFGVPLTREKTRYEDTTLFSGYPARRPFYPLTNNVYQEPLPSAADRYPYPIKALFLHLGTPGLSVPAANTQLSVLGDLEALPLFFACDIVIGESSMFADYIFPDVSIWERWGTPHTTPDVVVKASKVRQPMVAPIPEEVTVFGEQMPCSMEAVMLAIAERLGLSGHGKDGFGPGSVLTRPEDFYLKLVANIAFGDKPGETVAAASSEEMRIFLQARRSLPASVFAEGRWRRAVGEEHWPPVVTLLNRGGRWEEAVKGYDGERMAHRLGGLVNLYVEKTAGTRDSMTGQRFSGVGLVEPVRDSLGRPVDDSEFPLLAITYKDILGGQSRTLPTNYWMADLLPENYILVNSKTAKELGFSDGQTVQVVSASNPEGVWRLPNGERKPMVGKLRVTEGIRPGVVAVAWSFGHWAYGAQDVSVNGEIIRGDARRATGLCTNAVLRADPYLKNVCLTDPIGGSSSFYDTRVRLVQA